MPAFSSQLNLSLSTDEAQTFSHVTTKRGVAVLGLDGYNFAIDKLHLISGKYPMKSEVYLQNARVPDLDEYLAWKNVSHVALLQKYTIRHALEAYEKEYRLLSKDFGQDGSLHVPRALTNATVPESDSPEIDAARILTSLNFRALTMSGILQPHDFAPQSSEAISNQPVSPIFPRPDDLPMPDGADAFLLNPILENAQRRWVKGHHKEDQTKEILVKGANGFRTHAYKTIYLVDGAEFHDLAPQHKRPSVSNRKKRPTRLLQDDSDLTIRSEISVPNNESNSRKRPLDSGIALDNDFESSRQKRVRSGSSGDVPFSSMSKPDLGLRSKSSPSAGFRKVSSGSSSSGSQLSTKDFENLRAVLDPKAMSSVIGAITSSGQSIMPAPAITTRPQRPGAIVRDGAASSASSTARSTRRRPPPSPLNLAPPTRRTRVRVTPSPSPVTPTVTPQHSSASLTPRRNKYVPTTPNPLRWTATELYHLNGLARQGLHPKELHPKMMERFPDKQRSVHAIKDRRDKMARSKELQGKIPDYQARYGNIQE